MAKERFPLEVDNFLWIYISPWLLLLGLVGNSLVLVVMRRKRMRGSSTCVYLVCLSIFDTFALLSGVIPELSYALRLPLFATIAPATCRFEKFFFYCTSDTGIWVLVAFTFDRFIAVCFPLRKKSFCVPMRSKLACLAILLLAVAKNLHVFWTRTVVHQVDSDFLDFYLKKASKSKPSSTISPFANSSFNSTTIPFFTNTTTPLFTNTNTTTLFTNPPMKYKCDKAEPYVFFEKHIRPWIVFALISLLPFVVLVVCNSLIILTLQKRKKQHADLTKNVFSAQSSPSNEASRTSTACDTPSSRSERSPTAHLVSASAHLKSRVARVFHLITPKSLRPRKPVKECGESAADEVNNCDSSSSGGVVCGEGDGESSKPFPFKNADPPSLPSNTPSIPPQTTSPKTTQATKNTKSPNSTYKQTTTMCLAVSFAFLVCVSPSIVMLIGKPYWARNSDGSENQVYEVFKAVNNQLAYLNHSINFFMYCLTGGRFRAELVEMVRSWRVSACFRRRCCCIRAG